MTLSTLHIGGVFGDSFFACMLKNAFLHLIPAKSTKPTKLERLWEVGGGRPLHFVAEHTINKNKQKHIAKNVRNSIKNQL